MKSVKFFVRLSVASLTAFLFFSWFGCGGGESGLGESCTKTADCESGLKCVSLTCVKDEKTSDAYTTDTTADTSGKDGKTSDAYTTADTSGTGSSWKDPSSGLTWQNPPSENYMEWQEAMDYCANLTQDSHSDWRLPTISELRSLIRGCSGTESGGSCGVTDSCLSYSSCYDDACEGCDYQKGPADGCYWPNEMDGACYWYWSSSTPGGNVGSACHVYFGYGAVGFGGVGPGGVDDVGKGYPSYVRCVR